jgi:AGZA family xanthine/uracil permease-like MFS transporter
VSTQSDVYQSATRNGFAARLDQFFHLSERGSTPRTEFIAGITTFVTAAYLTVVIPSTLATAGVDIKGVTTTTILVFILATLGMAFYARLPFVVGPGLGPPAIIAGTLALTEGIHWQTGMAIAFWSGVLFMVLTLAGLREVVIRVVPADSRRASRESFAAGTVQRRQFRDADRGGRVRFERG